MRRKQIIDAIPLAAPVIAGRIRRQNQGRYEAFHAGQWQADSMRVLQFVLEVRHALPDEPEWHQVRRQLGNMSHCYCLLRSLAAYGYRDEDGVYQAESRWPS